MAGDTDDMAGMAEHEVGGLESSADGYTLSLAEAQPGQGRQRVAFTVIGPDGHPVTAYDEQHERDLHLVVVRRDLTGFQHLHPTPGRRPPGGGPPTSTSSRAPGGCWPTSCRPAVRRRCWARDLLVPGDFAPEPLGADAAVAQVDGYEVTLGGTVDAGEETVLTATVTQAGEPVTDLEPYLGAYGHLVSLRDGDLGYLHVAPGGRPARAGDRVRHRVPAARAVPAVPRVPARRLGAHRGVHGGEGPVDDRGEWP